MANIWYPVDDHGAVGDGVTNDQSAIQNAINTGEMACLTPNKTYLINSSLEIGEEKMLYIPPTAKLLFNAETNYYVAIKINRWGKLLGKGKIYSTRYSWDANNWNTNSRKMGIQIIGQGAIVEIGEIAGFEYGVDMSGNNKLISCNIYVSVFINILYLIIMNPTGSGCVNQNYIHWDGTSINWTNRQSYRTTSYGVYMDGVDNPNHNTISGNVEDYYYGLKLSGAFNRFLGLRLENCTYTILITNPDTSGSTRYNTFFGEYGDPADFYNKIWNKQTGYTKEYAIQIYGPEGDNYLNKIHYRNLYQISDSRLKKEVLIISHALEKIISLSGVQYKNIDNYSNNELHYGFIAQEFEKILPEIINKSGLEDFYSIDYISLIPIIVESIKELNNNQEELRVKLRLLDDLIKGKGT
mgnify:CR=1 FL=1